MWVGCRYVDCFAQCRTRMYNFTWREKTTDNETKRGKDKTVEVAKLVVVSPFFFRSFFLFCVCRWVARDGIKVLPPQSSPSLLLSSLHFLPPCIPHT